MIAVVLGGGINRNNKLPEFVKARLESALKLYKKRKVKKIVLCGKYSFLYPKNNLLKETESKLAKRYLIEKGVKNSDIFMENRSKDTVGNVYYAKKLFFLPRKEKLLIVCTSDFQKERARYLFKKIFGKLYDIKYEITPSNLSLSKKTRVLKRQKDILREYKKIFSKMKDGDHNFLKNKLYKIKFYKEQRPEWVKKFVSKAD